LLDGFPVLHGLVLREANRQQHCLGSFYDGLRRSFECGKLSNVSLGDKTTQHRAGSVFVVLDLSIEIVDLLLHVGHGHRRGLSHSEALDSGLGKDARISTFFLDLS